MELRDTALQYHAWGANVTAIGGAVLLVLAALCHLTFRS